MVKSVCKCAIENLVVCYKVQFARKPSFFFGVFVISFSAIFHYALAFQRPLGQLSAWVTSESQKKQKGRQLCGDVVGH